jgi:hypothetical protein
MSARDLFGEVGSDGNDGERNNGAVLPGDKSEEQGSAPSGTSPRHRLVPHDK